MNYAKEWNCGLLFCAQRDVDAGLIQLAAGKNSNARLTSFLKFLHFDTYKYWATLYPTELSSTLLSYCCALVILRSATSFTSTGRNLYNNVLFTVHDGNKVFYRLSFIILLLQALQKLGHTRRFLSIVFKNKPWGRPFFFILVTWKIYDMTGKLFARMCRWPLSSTEICLFSFYVNTFDRSLINIKAFCYEK